MTAKDGQPFNTTIMKNTSKTTAQITDNSTLINQTKPTTMKNTTITIENNGARIQFSLDTARGKSISKIQKALVLRFFDYYDTMRAIKAKGFKATEPFNVSMQVNNVLTWSTGSLGMEAQATLKLQNTVAGRIRYEQKLNRLIGFAIRSNETDVDKINKELEHLVTA